MHIYMYLFIYLFTHTHFYIYIYIYFIYLFMCVYVYTYIHIYAHIRDIIYNPEDPVSSGAGGPPSPQKPFCLLWPENSKNLHTPKPDTPQSQLSSHPRLRTPMPHPVPQNPTPHHPKRPDPIIRCLCVYQYFIPQKPFSKFLRPFR